MRRKNNLLYCQLKEIYGFDFPADFWQFWDFIEGLEQVFD